MLAAFSLRQLQDAKTLITLCNGMSISQILALIDEHVRPMLPSVIHEAAPPKKTGGKPCPSCGGIMIKEIKHMGRNQLEIIYHCKSCQFSQYGGRVR